MEGEGKSWRDAVGRPRWNAEVRLRAYRAARERLRGAVSCMRLTWDEVGIKTVGPREDPDAAQDMLFPKIYYKTCGSSPQQLNVISLWLFLLCLFSLKPGALALN
jgi:hypothetical protein